MKARSSTVEALRLDRVEHDRAGDAAQDAVVGLPGDELPPAVTIQALAEAASVTKPSPSTNQASRAPCSIAACRASTFGSSPIGLDVDAAPAVVRHADDGDALFGERLVARRVQRRAP